MHGPAQAPAAPPPSPASLALPGADGGDCDGGGRQMLAPTLSSRGSSTPPPSWTSGALGGEARLSAKVAVWIYESRSRAQMSNQSPRSLGGCGEGGGWREQGLRLPGGKAWEN